MFSLASQFDFSPKAATKV